MRNLKNLLIGPAESVGGTLIQAGDQTIHTIRAIRNWWILLGNARNYSRHRAHHKVDRSSWGQLRYTPQGFHYGGIVPSN